MIKSGTSHSDYFAPTKVYAAYSTMPLTSVQWEYRGWGKVIGGYNVPVVSIANGQDAESKMQYRGGDAMPSTTNEVTVETLEAFATAWNRHDVEALMTFMAADCVFEASAGPDSCGTRYVGREAVTAGYSEVWTTFPDAHWGNARHFVYGDRGVSEWVFTGTRLDGTRVEVNGCDLFTFRDGKIALKNSYRKNRIQSG
jgi:ketosteroid isomerase-like protein